MKPYIHVKFQDGRVFSVPTNAVVQDRAAYYHNRDKDEFPTLEDAVKDTTELFASDTYEIGEWAKNNMNWDELAPHARLVAYEPAAQDWMDAELSFHDAQTEIEPVKDGDNLMNVPLELALARISANRSVCNISTFADEKGQPVAALVLINGGPQVVEFFLGGLSSLTDAAHEAANASLEAPTTNIN